jgi:hypothetical protein
MWPSWNSRCAACIVRCVENPSLRLGLLRERRGRERRARALDAGLRLDARHRPRQVTIERSTSVAASASDKRRTFLATSTPFASKSLPLATRDVADARQRAAEGPAFSREAGFEIRVARRAEREPLLFAIDDQPDRDALDAAGAQAGLDLLPQHRRQRVAVEAIEMRRLLLRAHQVVVDVVRLPDRLVDGFLGDLVEDDPLDRTFGFST